MKRSRFDKSMDALSLGILVCTAVALAVLWRRLPDRIPLHYDFSGNITGYGGKASILIMPIISALLYTVISVAEHLPPESWNTGGIRVTHENAEHVYTCLHHLLSSTKCIFIAFHTGITVCQALGSRLWIVPLLAEVLVCLVNIVFWTVKAKKHT